MAEFSLLNHYVNGDLVGVWVETEDVEPAAAYKPGHETARLRAWSDIVEDKMPDHPQAQQMVDLASRLPYSQDQYVHDTIEAPSSPDPQLVLAMMIAEDARLRGR